MAKILRVNFDASNPEAVAPADENPPEVTEVRLHSAALTLGRWKDFDQVVFDLSDHRDTLFALANFDKHGAWRRQYRQRSGECG